MLIDIIVKLSAVAAVCLVFYQGSEVVKDEKEKK